MKRKILQLIPILVIFVASTGYSLTNKAAPVPSKVTTEQGTRYCDRCEPCCEPCPGPCNACQECEICPPCEPCSCCTDTVAIGIPKNCAYNAPARIDPACGWDAWLSLSFIYWQPKEGCLSLGSDRTDHLRSGNYFNCDFIAMETNYHPAFKIGAGMSFCRDDWTLFAEYTWFNSEDNTSYDLGSKFILGRTLSTPWIDDNILNTIGNNISALRSHWELSLNIVDLDLGRPYFVGQKLIFKPFYGLRGGTIDQLYVQKVTFNSYTSDVPVYAYSHNKSNSWILGPRAGLGTDWMLGCHYRIYGNLAAALFYQNFDIKVRHTVPIQKNNSSQIAGYGKYELSTITPNLDFELGLGYGSYFCNDQWYFDLTVGYSFNYFWNQNLLSPVSQSTEISASRKSTSCVAGDLMLQGLTITARLDF